MPGSLLELEEPEAMDSKEEPRAPREVVQGFRCPFPRKTGISRGWSLAALGSVTQIELQLAFPIFALYKSARLYRLGHRPMGLPFTWYLPTDYFLFTHAPLLVGCKLPEPKEGVLLILVPPVPILVNV